jgi:hypothetical protein
MERNYVCVWTGNKYPADYVRILFAGLKRKTRVDNFYCITDNQVDFDKQIQVIKLQQSDDTWWNKLQIFNKNQPLPTRLMYLDIDIVILQDLEPMWNLPYDRMLSIQDFHPRDAYRTQWMNSSVMLFDRDKCNFIWEEYIRNSSNWQKRFHGDQNYITHILEDKFERWPHNWCQSWKWDIDNPHRGLDSNCKIAVMHGRPKPHELLNHPIIADNWKL